MFSPEAGIGFDIRPQNEVNYGKGYHLEIGAYTASWRIYIFKLCHIGANLGLTAEKD